MSTFDAQAGGDVVAPLRDILISSVKAGWDRWKGLPAGARKSLTPTARANIVRDFIVDEATHRLKDITGVKRIDSGLRVLFRVAGQCLLVFKKLDDQGLGRNYPTQSALKFQTQEHLPGIPAEPRMHVGYTLTREGADIDRVLVSYVHERKDLSWVVELDEPLVAATVKRLPAASAPSPATARPRRVRAKGAPANANARSRTGNEGS